jgi:CubicO group peptidase (beta-lactamase class C family)
MSHEESAARRLMVALGRTLAVAAVAAVAAPLTAFALAQPLHAQVTGQALTHALDSAARAHIDSPIVPGVSVAVVRGGEVLLQGGYGFVDLEWGVHTPAAGDASYEIGSVTKQFTAAAILLLVEEGKVDLDADLTEYLDFDTQGRTVTVRRLMDHTSGIRSYTEMPVFGTLATLDLPQDTLVRLVEAEPFDFEPGTAQIYNNSAFFFLGLIVESLSGQTYEDFVQERLFDPAGMTESYYCDEVAMRDRRAHGYDMAGPEELIRAQYLNHAWPYAAGSLCSTVADLVKWNRALHGGRILSDASYHEMTTARPLENGMPIGYAMGITDGMRGEIPINSHGGGINGFVSMLEWYPEQELSIVVLQNSTAPPGAGALASAFANLVLGPVPDHVEQPFDGSLAELEGTYRGIARGQMMQIDVRANGGQLEFTPEGADAPMVPTHIGDLTWATGGTRLIFRRVGDAIGELRFTGGSAHYVLERIDS